MHKGLIILSSPFLAKYWKSWRSALGSQPRSNLSEFMRYLVILIVLVLIPTILCCESNDDCNNHGICKNDECVCDVLYYAPNCTFWADEISDAYTYWFYPYTVLNFGFFVASLVKFYQLTKATGFSRLRREFSVRHLSILMMVLGLLGMCDISIYNRY